MQPHIYSLAHKPASLEELVRKAKTFVAAAKAPATLKAYRNDWRDFESWCQAHQLPSLPSTPETVALYIADRASTLASGSIARRLTSITKAHQAAGYTDSPATTRHFVVGETLKGIRRTIGTAQHGKDPLLSADIRRIVAARRKDLIGLRDSAIVLVGFAGGFRRSELALINICDLKFSSANRRQIKRAPDGKWVCPSEPVRIHVRSALSGIGSPLPEFPTVPSSGQSAAMDMSRDAACTKTLLESS
jgi:site-specific recombinase XerD